MVQREGVVPKDETLEAFSCNWVREDNLAVHVERLRSVIPNTLTSAGSRDLSAGSSTETFRPLELKEGTSLLAVNLRGRRIQGSVKNIDFSGAHFGTDFDPEVGVDFASANLDHADLSNRFSYERRITALPAVVRGANLSHTQLELDGSTQLIDCDLSRCNLTLVKPKGDTIIDLSGCSVSGSLIFILKGAVVVLPKDISGCNIVPSGTDQLNLRGSLVVGASLSRVNPSALPDMSNLQGTRFMDTDFPPLDLSESNLREANLSGCDLTQVVLPKCLHGVTLDSAKFAPGALRDKDLRGATLSAMELSELPKDLSGVTLDRFDFRGADLSGFKLDGAKLRDCTSDLGTIFPEGMSQAVFDGHTGPLKLSNPEQQHWNFRGTAPDVALLQKLGPNVTLDGVTFEDQDLSQCEMRGWKITDSSFKNCLLPAEIAGASLALVGFEGSNRMPECIANSSLSDLTISDDSSVAQTQFVCNSYNGVVRATEECVPKAEGLDAAARRFFYPQEVSVEKLPDIIPMLATEFGKTYCLFWPRLTEPRHVHEFYIRRVDEDKWLLGVKDDEVALNGTIIDETWIVTKGGNIERCETETRSNFFRSEEDRKSTIAEDITSILNCGPSAGSRGPCMRVVDDNAHRSTPHYFRVDGMPSSFA
jgi:uncharacterized protein YjbI with pentapeptide repeats